MGAEVGPRIDGRHILHAPSDVPLPPRAGLPVRISGRDEPDLRQLQQDDGSERIVGGDMGADGGVYIVRLRSRRGAEPGIRRHGRWLDLRGQDNRLLPYTLFRGEGRGYVERGSQYDASGYVILCGLPQRG